MGEKRNPLTYDTKFSRRSVCRGALAFTIGCSAAAIIWTRALGAAPVVVHVMDFDLDAADVSSGSGQRPPLPPIGPLGRRQVDPQTRAHQLIELMSRSLLDDLEKAGVTARRLPRGAPLPRDGWLVRGVFLQIDQGNRLRRAVIGFGSGETEMQVAATADDLSKGPPASLYDIDTNAQSRSVPGAVVMLNPIAAGVRFVLAGHDLERNVTDCAEKIAAEVEYRVKATPPTR